MLQLKRGNLLEEKTEALVNTVNCVGVMGKGIALQFKQAFPDNFKQYQNACKAKAIQPGQMFIVDRGALLNPRYVINFPTKRHWRQPSRIEDIQIGLAALVRDVQSRSITSIAVPPLGCGNGGLVWADVKPLIIQAFEALPDVTVILFEPAGAPLTETIKAETIKAEMMKLGTAKPQMSPARAALLCLIDLYTQSGYRASRIEIQKLAYFLKVAGEPALQKLDYQRWHFGPYAHNLGHSLQHMEGHFIRGYGDGSDRAQIQVLPQGREEAVQYLQQSQSNNGAYLDRVSNLIQGFETPYGMEMLATLHWVAQENPDAASQVEIAIQRVGEWSDRKKNLFKPDHLRTAWHHLQDQGWLTIDPAVRTDSES
jgi:O-acetyl-ADP-ribose deacetylase (regulator of RNase III)